MTCCREARAIDFGVLVSGAAASSFDSTYYQSLGVEALAEQGLVLPSVQVRHDWVGHPEGDDSANFVTLVGDVGFRRPGGTNIFQLGIGFTRAISKTYEPDSSLKQNGFLLRVGYRFLFQAEKPPAGAINPYVEVRAPFGAVGEERASVIFGLALQLGFAIRHSP